MISGKSINPVKIEQKPISVNIAIWPACNYRCKFCFGHYRGLESEFVYDRVLEIPQILSEMGTEKITLEGGEPFLCKCLEEFLKVSKDVGLTTSIVTNGSLITEKKLKDIAPYLDWLGISIDSPSETTERLLGRGWGTHVKHSKEVASWAHKLGIKLKVNTVVTKYNVHEDLKPLYRELKPHRIKVFQFLHIKGENDRYAGVLQITGEEFKKFVNRHLELRDEGFNIVFESNEDMLGSYIMLLPSGRFFNNTNGEYMLSKHTLFTDPWKAFREIQWDADKFTRRGGKYDW